MKIRALCSKTRFENKLSPKYLGYRKLDIYFCPFFETPMTFVQNFLPFSAFGDFTHFNTFLIKNRKNVIFLVFSEGINM
jgi:hypothetical protein